MEDSEVCELFRKSSGANSASENSRRLLLRTQAAVNALGGGVPVFPAVLSVEDISKVGRTTEAEPNERARRLSDVPEAIDETSLPHEHGEAISLSPASISSVNSTSGCVRLSASTPRSSAESSVCSSTGTGRSVKLKAKNLREISTPPAILSSPSTDTMLLLPTSTSAVLVSPPAGAIASMLPSTSSGVTTLKAHTPVPHGSSDAERAVIASVNNADGIARQGSGMAAVVQARKEQQHPSRAPSNFQVTVEKHVGLAPVRSAVAILPGARHEQRWQHQIESATSRGIAGDSLDISDASETVSIETMPERVVTVTTNTMLSTSSDTAASDNSHESGGIEKHRITRVEMQATAGAGLHVDRRMLQGSLSAAANVEQCDVQVKRFAQGKRRQAMESIAAQQGLVKARVHMAVPARRVLNDDDVAEAAQFRERNELPRNGGELQQPKPRSSAAVTDSSGVKAASNAHGLLPHGTQITVRHELSASSPLMTTFLEKLLSSDSRGSGLALPSHQETLSAPAVVASATSAGETRLLILEQQLRTAEQHVNALQTQLERQQTGAQGQLFSLMVANQQAVQTQLHVLAAQAKEQRGGDYDHRNLQYAARPHSPPERLLSVPMASEHRLPMETPAPRVRQPVPATRPDDGRVADSSAAGRKGPGLLAEILAMDRTPEAPSPPTKQRSHVTTVPPLSQELPLWVPEIEALKGKVEALAADQLLTRKLDHRAALQEPAPLDRYYAAAPLSDELNATFPIDGVAAGHVRTPAAGGTFVVDVLKDLAKLRSKESSIAESLSAMSRMQRRAETDERLGWFIKQTATTRANLAGVDKSRLKLLVDEHIVAASHQVQDQLDELARQADLALSLSIKSKRPPVAVTTVAFGRSTSAKERVRLVQTKVKTGFKHDPLSAKSSGMLLAAEKENLPLHLSKMDAMPADLYKDENYLKRVYGRALYDNRRTLKKASQPRSPKQRPIPYRNSSPPRVKSTKVQAGSGHVAVVSPTPEAHHERTSFPEPTAAELYRPAVKSKATSVIPAQDCKAPVTIVLGPGMTTDVAPCVPLRVASKQHKASTVGGTVQLSATRVIDACLSGTVPARDLEHAEDVFVGQRSRDSSAASDVTSSDEEDKGLSSEEPAKEQNLDNKDHMSKHNPNGRVSPVNKNNNADGDVASPLLTSSSTTSLTSTKDPRQATAHETKQPIATSSLPLLSLSPSGSSASSPPRVDADKSPPDTRLLGRRAWQMYTEPQFQHEESVVEEEQGSREDEIAEPPVCLPGFRARQPPAAHTPQFPQRATVMDPERMPVAMQQKRMPACDPTADAATDWIEQRVMAMMVRRILSTAKSDLDKSASEGEDAEEQDYEDKGSCLKEGNSLYDGALNHGFQVFVDAGVSVDETLFSSLVRECLAEKVRTMLGTRQEVARHSEEGSAYYSGSSTAAMLKSAADYRLADRVVTPVTTPRTQSPLRLSVDRDVITPAVTPAELDEAVADDIAEQLNISEQMLPSASATQRHEESTLLKAVKENMEPFNLSQVSLWETMTMGRNRGAPAFVSSMHLPGEGGAVMAAMAPEQSHDIPTPTGTPPHQPSPASSPAASSARSSPIPTPATTSPAKSDSGSDRRQTSAVKQSSQAATSSLPLPRMFEAAIELHLREDAGLTRPEIAPQQPVAADRQRTPSPSNSQQHLDTSSGDVSHSAAHTSAITVTETLNEPLSEGEWLLKSEGQVTCEETTDTAAPPSDSASSLSSEDEHYANTSAAAHVGDTSDGELKTGKPNPLLSLLVKVQEPVRRLGERASSNNDTRPLVVLPDKPHDSRHLPLSRQVSPGELRGLSEGINARPDATLTLSDLQESTSANLSESRSLQLEQQQLAVLRSVNSNELTGMRVSLEESSLKDEGFAKSQVETVRSKVTEVKQDALAGSSLMRRAGFGMIQATGDHREGTRPKPKLGTSTASPTFRDKGHATSREIGASGNRSLDSAVVESSEALGSTQTTDRMDVDSLMRSSLYVDASYDDTSKNHGPVAAGETDARDTLTQSKSAGVHAVDESLFLAPVAAVSAVTKPSLLGPRMLSLKIPAASESSDESLPSSENTSDSSSMD